MPSVVWRSHIARAAALQAVAMGVRAAIYLLALGIEPSEIKVPQFLAAKYKTGEVAEWSKAALC